MGQSVEKLTTEENNNIMAKFSVIIPCYNAAKVITKCLDALADQTFKDFDVILTNDCSTDNTIEVLNACKKTYPLTITIVENVVNSGPAVSRINAAKVSTADFLCFCDADDWYDTDFLYKFNESLKTSNAELVFTGFKRIIANKIIPYKYTENDLYDLTKEIAFVKGFNSLCVLTVKRTLFLETPQIDLRNGEDMALVPLLIAKANKINLLSGTGYNYLCQPGTASHNANTKVVNSLLASYKHIEVNMPAENKDIVEYLGIRNVLYGVLLNLFKFSYDKITANKIISEFEEKYSNWEDNRFINKLPKGRRVFIFFVKKRNFVMLKAFSMMHKVLTTL